MSKKEKLVSRLLSNPKDFTFEELVTLLGYFGFWKANAGKTSGSRVEFRNSEGQILKLHKPHPGNIWKPYQLKQINDELERRGLL